MLGLITKLFKSARSKNNGPEHYKTNDTANPTSTAYSTEWQPLDVTKLNITTNRVREIEASMVKDARSEFANVMQQLKSSQHARNSEKN
ncbi:MAG TPA: hypothetical protein VJ965_05685 [Anaerolineales bacterium]|nr:hypothetical protein [Anaerolineales bacterium]